MYILCDRHGIAATLLGDTDADHRVAIAVSLVVRVTWCEINPGVVFRFARTVDDVGDVTQVDGYAIDHVDHERIKFVHRANKITTFQFD